MKGTMDILRKGINKGIALEKLAEYYQVSSDEVIAVGDNNNDIDMIKYAGMGVAMGNAENKVKDVAQYITATNTDGGIVRVIQEYIL
jgi:hydroxymethylpyrimidine pyrophosphatase-like HAD family hydrolase